MTRGYRARHTEVPIQPFVQRLTSRGYECDPSGSVPIARLFSYCEHQRWETMRNPELGLVEAVHEGHFFVVLEQQMERLESFGMSVPLRLEMTLEQVGRSAAWVRHALVRESDDRLLAIARVRGGWIGPNRRLARVPNRLRELAKLQGHAWEDVTSDAGTGGTPGSWFDPPTRRRTSEGLLTPPDQAPSTVCLERLVQPRDADVFSHVNAATYLRFFEDAVTPSATTWRASLRYKKEARPGQVLTIHGEENNGIWHCAATRDGELLVTAAIEAQPEPRVDEGAV